MEGFLFQKMIKYFKIKNISIYLLIFLWLMLASFPFLWTFWGSFKVELDFFSISNWYNAVVGKNTFETYETNFTGAGYIGA